MRKLHYLAKQTGIQTPRVKAAVKLFDEGAQIPFIARYRKELTQGLNEVELTKIKDFSNRYEELLKRQESILNRIEEQGKLTKELREKIENCLNMDLLEDLYLPYKKKRKTRADQARELGLEALAKILMAGNQDPENAANQFVVGEISSAEALSGARDIIAEWINENRIVREKLRVTYRDYSKLNATVVKEKEEEAIKYKAYFQYSSSLKHCPSHRFLAMYRASKEGLLRIKLEVNQEYIYTFLARFFTKKNALSKEQIELACQEAYKRLLHPALENEALQNKKKQADEEAIEVFSANLRQLLLAPALGKKRILALDPGFRTGCKLVCLDESGDLLTHSVIYPHSSLREREKAADEVRSLVDKYAIHTIGIGNGTASRETEDWLRGLSFSKELPIYVVSEEGASIYSASEIAREEFPDYDLTVRGAISIGRRLMDPLAELVKIDPKSIGVGQYQHEVDQKRLKEKLDEVVISCVNEVGVNLNTASPYLLRYVSGLGVQLAENIIAYRREIGGFSSREELLQVNRLGAKAFEQCAGFLRIKNARNPLDNSAVHPESYGAIQKIAAHKGISVKEMIGNEEVLDRLKQEHFDFIDDYTFRDVLEELKKPGRDPRGKLEVMAFDKNIKTLEDLKVGTKLKGIITNITNFGAFVDIGIKENGLIHKSNLSDAYVENPADYVSLNQQVWVEVLQIEKERKRIGLKMLK